MYDDEHSLGAGKPPTYSATFIPPPKPLPDPPGAPAVTDLQREADERLRALGGRLVVTLLDDIFEWIVKHCTKTGRQAYTHEVEVAFAEHPDVTVRGILARLVKDGRLLRPMRGSYVPVVEKIEA